MNKDVIYIDIEDDITAIIGKVKHAGSKIVALVPPKRAGVLQSAVNLKLLQKAADTADKRVVLITSDHSLTTLAAGVKMPIAKNLQSKPEVPEFESPQADDEEIINGADLPVGEMAAAMGTGAAPETLAESMSEHIDLKDAPKASDIAAKSDEPKKMTEPFAKKMSGKLNIPDFTTFRNKFFLIGGIGGALVIFLVWALVFAPHASIKISAETIGVSIDRTLALDPKAAASDTAKLAVKPNVQQVKKSVATTFAATGQKDIGNKASGTITVYNCDSGSSFSLQAGTTFVSNGKQFKSNAAVNVGGLTGSASSCRNSASHPGAGTGNVAVTAVDLGDEYNVAAGDFTINGIGGDVYAASAEAMAGGSHQMATVVSQEDVDKATQQLAQPPATSDIKNDLKKQFVGDYVVIEESFKADQGTPVIEPAVGQPGQQAKITVETTYTYVGISRADAKAVIGDVVNGALQGKTDQQMYSLGDNAIKFQTFQRLDGGTFTTRFTTTAYIGPKIDTKALAKQIVGKRFGEIQTMINQIQGVQKVDIELSPFWVNTAPSTDKIDISFSVGNGQ